MVGERPEQQVVQHGEPPEQVTTFGHVRDPRPDDLVRGAAVDPPSLVLDAPGRGLEQAGDGAQEG